jgi:predicted ATPase
MVALYRSGRQPEALRAYRRACDAFAELGVVPSEDLERLETQILLRDPTLDAATSESAVGNLPAPLSSFVGREADVVKVRELVVGRRLVTLVGPGGVGKTRLAVETARRLAGWFRDGTWVVELAGVDKSDLVAPQVADALGVVEGSARDVATGLVEFMRERDLLLVMDNCEHLVGPVAALAADLLAGCHRLHVLVTSRQPLGIEAETTWHTEPLSVRAGQDTALDVARVEAPPPAVQLFFDRVRAAQPSLEVTTEDVPLASEVCRRLGGLPLAIELAAARLRLMSLRQLAQRLDDQFEVLTDGPSHAVGHHRAMRATLDWSYDLLDPPERALFRRLSVFRGGFTLDTAERFHAANPSGGGTTLQLLGHLVDASMVEARPGDRFTILEPIRQYGLLVLDEHGEKASARTSHCLVYREMFRLEDDHLYGPAPGSPLEGQFATEIHNVRAALSWADERGDTATVGELGSVALCLLGAIGYLAEADRWLDRVVAATPEASPYRARALARGAFISAVLHGRAAAEDIVNQLEATAEALDDDRWRAACVERRALLAWLEDDFDTASRLWGEATERLLELDCPSVAMPLSNHMEALAKAGELGRADAVAEQLADVGDRYDLPELVADSLLGRSYTAVYRGDADAAERHLDAAERHLGAELHVPGAGRFDSYGSMFLPGFIALLRGDVDEAEQSCSAALTDAQRSRHPDAHLRGMVLMALVHLHRSDPETGQRLLREGLAETRRRGLTHYQRYVLGAIAATWAMIEPVRGTTLLAAIEALNRRDGRTLAAPIARAVDQATVAVHESLSDDDLTSSWQRGATMTFDDAVELALQRPAGDVRTDVEEPTTR